MGFWTAKRLREVLSTFPDDLPIEVETPDAPGSTTGVTWAVTAIEQAGSPGSVYIMCDYKSPDEKGRQWTDPEWDSPYIPPGAVDATPDTRFE